jgi:hypothetical protein
VSANAGVARIERFFARHPIFYCDTPFQEHFPKLDEPLIGRSERSQWRPHFLKGKQAESDGTETGYVLNPRCSPGPWDALVPDSVHRWWRHRRTLPKMRGFVPKQAKRAAATPA